MLLGGYTRCALGNLARSLDVRPETAESWQEPEERVGILALQLERALSQERTSSPSRMAGRAHARHAGLIPSSCTCHADNVSINGRRP